MERIEYDPEIDPSIREAREAAAREQELAARIRLEIERYVEENDLVPRGVAAQDPPWDDDPEIGKEETPEDGAAPKTRRARAREAKEVARRAKEEAQQAALKAKIATRKARREQRAVTAATSRRAVQSVVTGSILSSEWVRRMWPYLLGVATVLVMYIGYNFHVQKLHFDRQRLEREVRELGIEAVERTALRVEQTRRSAIVERLHEKNIPLEEFPHPVKKIER